MSDDRELIIEGFDLTGLNATQALRLGAVTADLIAAAEARGRQWAVDQLRTETAFGAWDTHRRSRNVTDATAVHSALVAKVTEYLTLAEDVPVNWRDLVDVRHRSTFTKDWEAAEAVKVFHWNHSPAFAILVHRQALETLNRHRPDSVIGCVTCRGLWPCAEFVGVRAVYLPEAE